MGFLDSLKEIGIGNTGSRGRMDSGATNYAQYSQARAGVEGQRGVSQALALAAKEGKPVSFQQMNEIAEKWGPWGVTMNDVMGAAKPMNVKLEGDQIKTEAAALMGAINKLTPDERKSLDGPKLQALNEKLGNTNPNTTMAVMKRMQALGGTSKTFSASAGSSVYETKTTALGGNKTTLIDQVPHKPTAPKEAKTPNEIELIQRAQAGDPKAQKLLDALMARKQKGGAAAAKGKLEGLFSEAGVDPDVSAKAVLEGRETIENVKNTFGVPIQEIVRKKVLEVEPDFNFVVPRAVVKGLSNSLANQEKQRGMMGSFVRNIDKQLVRVDELYDNVGRLGVRALDMPIRELKKRFVGSGKEVVLDAYMMEISNEINKLSQGSQASIAQLGEESQQRWNKVHDPSLSYNEIMTVITETRNMAQMRMASVNEELDFTRSRLERLKSGGSSSLQRSTPTIEQAPPKFEILKVED
jgi:hypothetical protein